jgi:chorismate dehydratase
VERQANQAKLGAIAYINTLPLMHGLAPPANTVVYGKPTTLNQAMLAGELLLSPVSSAFYVQHQQALHLWPSISISSFGGVDSVLFISQRPWGSWLAEAAVIPVDASSASSVALLVWLAKQAFGVDISSRCVPYPPAELPAVLARFGCALSIGDAALVFEHQQRQDNLAPSPLGRGQGEGNAWHRLDLATAWKQATGLPFVFAVWVSPKGVSGAEAEQCQAWLAAMQAQTVANLAVGSPAWQAMLAEGQRMSRLSPEALERYWCHSLAYGWSEAHSQSLALWQTCLAVNG